MRFMNLKVIGFSAITLTTLTAFIVGCSSSKDGGGSAPSTSSLNYGGPGSVWTASVSGNTFSMRRVEGSDVINLGGNISTLSTGFRKLAVTSSDGVGAPAPGSTAYALNVPGYVLLVKPIGGDPEIIPMVATGSCPTSNFSINWVNTRDHSPVTDNSAHVGVATWDVAGSTMDISKEYEYGGDALRPGPNTVSGACANGVIELGGGNKTHLWLTQAGGAIIADTDDVDGPKQALLGINKETANVPVASIAGDYAGLLFAASTGNDAEPYAVTIASNGDVSATEYSDVEAGTTTGAPVTFTLSQFLAETGFLQATVGGEKLRCAVDLNANGSGKNLIVCAGRDPGDDTKLYSLVMVQK